jgi:hypothetical protein
MRLLLTALLVYAAFSQSFSQECVNPIDKNTFQEGFNQVAVQSTPAKKLSMAQIFVKGKCLQASQVKTMAQLFTEDVSRLAFCKDAYAITTDKGNFYDVYDAFENFSYAFRLHDFVRASAEPQAIAPPPAPVEQVLTFPRYSYPNSSSYKGVTGCQGPVASEEQFRKAANNAYAQPTEESKQLALVNAVEANCFDFAQTMKLVSILSSEEIKLKTLTKIFSNVYDLESYKFGSQLFLTKNLQAEWLKYGAFYLTPPAAACEESDADFEVVLKQVRAKFFDHERIKLMETFSIDHCFKVSQIKRLVNEVTPAARNVDIFKRFYDKCPDKDNYSQLVNELFFASEKQELEAFLKSKSR